MSDPLKRRRQLVGFILSGIFPGLGQLYNREYLKGVLFIVPSAVLTWLLYRAVPTDLLALAQPNSTLMLLAAALLAIWLWAIIDAWKVAGR
jgi:hypothetical protein